MKIEIKETFVDKDEDYKIIQKGKIVERNEERAEELINLGFAIPAEEEEEPEIKEEEQAEEEPEIKEEEQTEEEPAKEKPAKEEKAVVKTKEEKATKKRK